MAGVLESLGKIPSSEIVRYILGDLFLLMSLGSIGSHGFIAGLLFLLAAIIIIPTSASLVEKKISTSMPGIAQFFIVFLLVAVALAAFPTPTPVNNTTNNTKTITAPPSANNGSEILVVAAAPKQVVTPTPVAKSAHVATQTSGTVPLNVMFTDTTIGTPLPGNGTLGIEALQICRILHIFTKAQEHMPSA